MKITVIGATGFVGQEVINEALARGHQVTAVSRSGKNLPQHSNLTLATGDIHDSDWLNSVLRSQDAVISAYNPGWSESDLFEKFTRGSTQILAAVRAAQVKRLLVVGGAGSLQVAPGVELVDTEAFPAEIKPGALGARALRNTLQSSGGDLDWTYLSPAAMLQPGARTGQFRIGSTELLMSGDHPASISVADLAVAIVDEIEHPQHLQKQFTVAY
ncbi:NAD(P)-dependent oxidoreductase [Winslowiella iniecta]|uniref:3-beta hydroxysteroid dehydrogenase n=1 Tax=Winslowiella iniecta TaxID=1560201 RepID=A0A0L7TF78_9GAMM|nr:NAD(P)H-binding protein [Winslowiella iniecta]KOC90900.1 3-beta hydroxysteroid dehydrogenase [Winslowiella iniecta]KOC94008.1 3-beta hydroxysteroid dehydrogenase [Winslowiella iniecta]